MCLCIVFLSISFPCDLLNFMNLSWLSDIENSCPLLLQKLFLISSLLWEFNYIHVRVYDCVLICVFYSDLLFSLLFIFVPVWIFSTYMSLSSIILSSAVFILTFSPFNEFLIPDTKCFQLLNVYLNFFIDSNSL